MRSEATIEKSNWCEFVQFGVNKKKRHAERLLSEVEVRFSISQNRVRKTTDKI